MSTTVNVLISVDPEATFPSRSWAGISRAKEPEVPEGSIDLGADIRLALTATTARRLAESLTDAASNWEAGMS